MFMGVLTMMPFPMDTPSPTEEMGPTDIGLIYNKNTVLGRVVSDGDWRQVRKPTLQSVAKDIKENWILENEGPVCMNEGKGFGSPLGSRCSWACEYVVIVFGRMVAGWAAFPVMRLVSVCDVTGRSNFVNMFH